MKNKYKSNNLVACIKEMNKRVKRLIYSILIMIRMKHPLKQFGFFLPKDSIAVHWWAGKNNKNFGDVITPYLVGKISNKKPIWVNKYCFRKYYIVTGSILTDANKNSIIWGAGIMAKDQKIIKPKEIFMVRGPLTRKRLLELGIPCPEIYGDPALLLPLFYKPNTKKKYELGIIPHHMDYPLLKKKIGGNALVINLLDPIEKVIKDICSCKKTISSSLHGIIVSHTYEIPSVWAEFSNEVGGDGTKFMDYFLSVGIKKYKPINLKNKKKDININKLIKLIDKKHNKKIKINKGKLLEACPFRN